MTYASFTAIIFKFYSLFYAAELSVHTVIRIVQCFPKPKKSLTRAIFLFFLAYMQKKA